ncbi:hypothetical protein K402DRAFT_224840 [Aulographum hederae CBS 113979]|uniref:Uncharacterized protein n=1 Tax=Aulographum hederae CBS 113979 TaxID=1176131 RepID=A0A6G1HAJ2_9PEZI|nr:hypothetical protein K402DRAFT_224840 [Aulographum hederae CBS 113979]
MYHVVRPHRSWPFGTLAHNLQNSSRACTSSTFSPSPFSNLLSAYLRAGLQRRTRRGVAAMEESSIKEERTSEHEAQVDDTDPRTETPSLDPNDAELQGQTDSNQEKRAEDKEHATFLASDDAELQTGTTLDRENCEDDEVHSTQALVVAATEQHVQQQINHNQEKRVDGVDHLTGLANELLIHIASFVVDDVLTDFDRDAFTADDWKLAMTALKGPLLAHSVLRHATLTAFRDAEVTVAAGRGFGNRYHDVPEFPFRSLVTKIDFYERLPSMRENHAEVAQLSKNTLVHMARKPGAGAIRLLTCTSC